MHPTKTREGGAVMVIGTIFLIALLGLTAAFYPQANSQSKFVQKDAGIKGAVYAAEGGVAAAKIELYAGKLDGFSDELKGPDGQGGTNDDGVLADIGSADVSISTGTTYNVRVVDNDDGDNDAYADADNTVLVRSTGTHLATVVSKTLEVGVSIVPEASYIQKKAILTKGDLSISGNPDVQGELGSVHSNDDLTIQGDAIIELYATATGDVTVIGAPTVNGVTLSDPQDRSEFEAENSDRPPDPIPEVDPTEFLPLADYILYSTGENAGKVGVKNVDGTITIQDPPIGGFTYSSRGGWDQQGSGALLGGIYYVEGDLKISGNPGTTEAPWTASIIATGDVAISGTPKMVKDADTNVVVVAGHDMKITGNPNQEFEGIFLVGDQVSINGNPSIEGAVTEANQSTTSNLVRINSISGSVVLEFNGAGEIPQLVITNVDIYESSYVVK